MININSDQEFKSFIEENKEKAVFLISFGASWCGYCRMIKPILTSLSENYPVGYVDLTEKDELKEQLKLQNNISGIPVTQIYKKGKFYKEIVGFVAEANLKKELQ